MHNQILKASLVNDQGSTTTNHNNPLLTDTKNSKYIDTTSIPKVRDKRNNNSTDKVTNSATKHKKVQEFARGQFKPFIKESCPVCGDNKGNCRYSTTDPDFIQCQTYADARYKDVINGYICVKESSGHTASFKPYNGDYKRKSKTEWLQEKALRDKKRREQKEAETEEKKEKALSAEERHKLYSEIIEELIKAGLRADLRESRGLTESENQVVEVYQIKKYHQLTKKYDERLPGLSKLDKSCLGNSGDGLIGFIRNADNLIVGFQYRLTNSNDGGRYRWGSSSDASVHTKKFGELPLAVYVPSEIKSLSIQLVEGTIIKPQIAAERMGMITIGASGGNFLSSEETLRGTIDKIQEAICQELKTSGLQLIIQEEKETKLRKSKELLPKNGEESKTKKQDSTISVSHYESTQNDYLRLQLRNFVKKIQNSEIQRLSFRITPDAGSVLNKQVLAKIKDLSTWLKKEYRNSAIVFSDWNQIDKSQGDIDEIKDLSRIRSISNKGFNLKYKEAIVSCKGFGKFQNWANRRKKLTADILQYEKWLTIPKGIEKTCDLLLIRKALGGGKTQALIEYLKSVNHTALLIGYRNTLLYNTIDRANKMGLSAQHIKEAKERIEGRYLNFAADDSIRLWGGCADSFFKFNAVINYQPEYIVVHDEICSVLGHLKGGGTLKGRQQQAIEWDVETINNSSFAIMMDANLCDDDVEFLQKVFPNKRIKVLDSISETKKRTFYFLETKSHKSDFSRDPKYLSSQLIDKAKKHDKVLWVSDSQGSCEDIDNILSKLGDKHFRLDGKTSKDEVSKAFQSAPKEFIVSGNFDSVSLSPSGESGLSIDLYKHFDAVCFDIRGIVSVNTLIQLSARLRDTNVPIYVACPEFVNITENLCPYALKKVDEVLAQRIDLNAAIASRADEELSLSEIWVKMCDEMKNFVKNPWFMSSLEDGQKLKYEHQNLKLALKTALAQDGNKIIDLVEVENVLTKEEQKLIAEERKDKEARQYFESESIDYEKAQELSKKDLDWETKCKVIKAKFKHSLPGIENTESWEVDLIRALVVDNPKFVSQRWRLMQLQDPELFNAVFTIQKRFNFENGFSPKDIWKSDSTKIEALKLMGVGKIIEKGIFSSSDKWLQDIIDKYYEDDSWFKLIGITRAKKDKQGQYYNKMTSRFLEYFGLKTGEYKKVIGKRFYPIQPIEAALQFIDDIDKCLQKRAENTLNEAKTISLSQTILEVEKIKSRNEKWDTQYNKELNIRKLEACLPEEWKAPGSIEDVAQMLLACDSPEMAKDLYRCDIPDEVFHLAEMQIPPSKQAELMAWKFS